SEDDTEGCIEHKNEIDGQGESGQQDRTGQTGNRMEKAQREIDDTKARITQAEKDLGKADERIDDAKAEIDRLEKDLDGLEYENRNLIQNSRGDMIDDWIKWSDSTLSNYTSSSFASGKEWIWTRNSSSIAVGVHTPRFDLKANETCTISFTIRSLSNSGYQFNYLYLRQGASSITTIKSLPSVNMLGDNFNGDS